MDKTKIEWCDSTWNPITGCFNGCEYCYARRMTERFAGTQKYANIYELDEPERDGNGKAKPYPYSFSPTFHKYRLNDYANKKGRTIFVCSMADMFGDWVPNSWIDAVFDACEKAKQHRYLFLTKNPERYSQHGYLDNDSFWYGTSVTKESEMRRFNSLPTFANKFVSMEPILEDMKPDKHNIMFIQIDWLIIGAETGRRRNGENRVIAQKGWIDDICRVVDRMNMSSCRDHPLPIFMKDSLVPIIGEENMRREFPWEV